ncbi:CehA/McbA family metallohydrolase [Butyrivibrio sp. MC2013]|uniref:CehA/McbA family metallohydrolase n=1 Tax=Butyrivibrio sp. MC2013 TaxID=1280686 RepID=UPI000422F051|nr:CehA/McbA family metallohydrolase [Butyrivibrio sp. MC2013]
MMRRTTRLIAARTLLASMLGTYALSGVSAFDSMAAESASVFEEAAAETVAAEDEIAEVTMPDLADGDQIVIYHPASGTVLSSSVSGKKLAGAAATSTEDGLTVEEDYAVLTVDVDESTGYVTLSDDGMYLTSPATGNGLSLEAEAGDYSHWLIEKAEADGLYTLKNTLAVFKDSAQYLEYYNGYTTYSMKTAGDAYYFALMDADSVKAPAAEEPIEDQPGEDELPGEEETPLPEDTSLVKDGDEIVLYHPASQTAMSAAASGSKLAAVEAAKDGDGLKIEGDYAVLTVNVNEENGYAALVSDGKYLTTGATGNNLSFKAEADDYSYWLFEEVEGTDGLVTVKNIAAAYNGNAQYLEYFKGYTTYSFKAGNDAYLFSIYDADKINAAAEGEVVYDEKASVTVARFAGTADYEAAGVTDLICGDLYEDNDLLDTNSAFTAVLSGQNVGVWEKTAANGGESYNYYMRAVGVGSGTDDYLQLTFPGRGYANMDMAFRLRASNTGAGSFQLKVSTDGENFTNLTKGTYSYSYTDYSGEAPAPVVGSGDITDGIAKTSLSPAKYVEFTFELPAECNNADKVYVRLVPGSEAAKSGKTITSGGTVRMDSVVVKANPACGGSMTGYVKSSIPSGEAAIGQKLTLSSDTKDARIYYSLDKGVSYSEYTEAVELTELPLTVSAYAVSDNRADSIVTIYSYTKAGTPSVKATPGGGAVRVGQKVKLTCEAEDAVIYYAFADSADAQVADDAWQTYTEPVEIKELPAVIKAKACKEGCSESPVSTASFTLRQNENYNIYFGQIHSHTSYSDGSGTCEEAFAHASKVDNLDFLAVTDHSNSLDNADSSELAKNVDTADTDEWTMGHSLAKQYTTDDFVAFYGFEMTWSNGLGHMNTFNTPGFQSRTQAAYKTYGTALNNYYNTLSTVPDSISQFNHPGTTFGDFQDFAYYTGERDNLITMIEVGNGEGAIGSSGYFPSYEYYTRALDKGWHVAPTNNQDNHKGKWGDANTARTVILADSLTEENIYDAMRSYRIYATEDNDLSIYYTLDGNVMGSVLEKDMVGDEVTIKAEISDPDASDTIGKVEVIVNGGLSIASQNVNVNKETVTFKVPANYSYYYLKVTEGDRDIAVTAPVWVGEVEACGINKTYTQTDLPVAGEDVDVNVGFYNNEKEPLSVDSLTVTADGELVKTVSAAELAEAGVSSLATGSEATYRFDFNTSKVGKVKLDITANCTLRGVAKVYKDVLELNLTDASLVSNVIVDGSHYNDYVTGYYGGNMTSFVKLAAGDNIRVRIDTDGITRQELEDCKLLIVSAPAKKSGTANAGDYTPAHFEDDFISMVADYVAAGGDLIVCGLADYQDSTSGRTAEEINKLLEGVGATIKLNSDEVWDDENNGGQQYRMYMTNLNMDSSFLKGVVEGQAYSQYSGCSVNVEDAVENDNVYAAEALVRGFDTTCSKDCKDDAGNSIKEQPVLIEQGKVVVLGHQATKAGGNIFAAGGVFMSDFEVNAEIDNNDSLPYANRNIILNILDGAKTELSLTSIADARKGNMGDVFAVEGYVTSGTVNEKTTFFDTIYIQDETGGMDIFPYAEPGLEIGTKVRVVGKLDAYQGDLELRAISVDILDAEKKIYDPRQLSTKDAMDYDAFGGSLIRTKGNVERVEYAENGETVAEFWIKDESGKEAAIFIDGYIASGTTGKNEIGSFVKEGAYISAAGILYMHPEGDSDVSVPVLRVRDTDDIFETERPAVEDPGDQPGGEEPGVEPGTDPEPEPVITGKWVISWRGIRYVLSDKTYLKGLQTIGKNTYYFDKNGYLVLDEFVKIGKDTYYFDITGRMAKDCYVFFIYRRGKWFHFFRFDKNGRLVG